jgi:predicted dinucleotide-binding enzyme
MLDSMKKVAVLGSGKVGEVLANGLLKHGYEVMRGSRDVARLADWKKQAGAKAQVGTFEEAAKWGDGVLLAVKGSAAEEVVGRCGAALDGKTVIDASNPIADAPPEPGTIRYFTGPNESLMERLQSKAPKAHFVKAFSCVGNAFMVNPNFGGELPTMFICGDDAGAKKDVGEVLTRFGWDIEDLGGVKSARGIEPLCITWCLPGLTRGQWAHAFKLLRK